MNDIPRRKGTMDVRTSFLICLGAATAANCIPCFEHYHKKVKGNPGREMQLRSG
jgi:alkylhydroperoxidase/carboxymuconolactone decarboxylase family protein YurZ